MRTVTRLVLSDDNPIDKAISAVQFAADIATDVSAAILNLASAIPMAGTLAKVVNEVFNLYKVS